MVLSQPRKSQRNIWWCMRMIKTVAETIAWIAEERGSEDPVRNIYSVWMG